MTRNHIQKREQKNPFLSVKNLHDRINKRKKLLNRNQQLELGAGRRSFLLELWSQG